MASAVTAPARPAGVSRERLIPLLQEIQTREGYVSRSAMMELAAALDTPVATVYGVATFYNQFRFAPLGEHVIEVCRGTACHVKQSLALLQHLQRRLKLRPDGNSADGRVSVLTVACVGACSIAPVIKLDGEFYGDLTVEKLDAILDGIMKPGKGEGAAGGAVADAVDGGTADGPASRVTAAAPRVTAAARRVTSAAPQGAAAAPQDVAPKAGAARLGPARRVAAPQAAPDAPTEAGLS